MRPLGRLTARSARSSRAWAGWPLSASCSCFCSSPFFSFPRFFPVSASCFFPFGRLLVSVWCLHFFLELLPRPGLLSVVFLRECRAGPTQFFSGNRTLSARDGERRRRAKALALMNDHRPTDGNFILLSHFFFNFTENVRLKNRFQDGTVAPVGGFLTAIFQLSYSRI